MDPKYRQQLIEIGMQKKPLNRRDYEQYQEMRVRHEAEEARLIEEARNRGMNIVTNSSSHSH